MPGVKKIKDINSLVSHLKSDIGCYKGDKWFRGHSVYSWDLLPSILRDSNLPTEKTLLKRFKQCAAFLLQNKPDTDFEWMFLMQHYGLPTRLLDWSESPLTALYFAVEQEKFKDKDGALWMLFPSKLNINANIDADEENYIPSFEDTELENYKITTLGSEKTTKMNPVAAIATRNNPRIQAQQGVFTIYHRNKTAIEKIGDKTHVFKYVIKSGDKKNILNELRLLGINRFTLFPELSSIVDNIEKGE